MKTFAHIRPGHRVVRNLAGIKMEIIVTEVTEDKIICGEHGWEFDRNTGAELDDLLGWGPPPKMTGSFLEL